MGDLRYSLQVRSAEIKHRFEATDTCKAMRANISEHGGGSGEAWVVEYVREMHGCLEAWLFRKSPGKAQPMEHIHVTVRPDRSETTISIHFMLVEGSPPIIYG